MLPAVKRLLALVITVLSTSAAGCYSKATAHDAKFTFAYAAGADFENFVKPIAPGAKLDVVVFANGTEDKLVIRSARSSKPGVLAVESVNERTLVLKGVAPGVADIEVTARDSSGKTLVDRVYLHVEKPTVHGISHSCTERADAIYVEGADVSVYHALATGDGRPVIGYGYVPVRVEPASGLELVAQPQGAAVYVYRAPQASPRITLRSTVDEGALSMRIVKQGELKNATLDCGDDECVTFEGRRRYVVAHVTAGETPVCSQNALTRARSLTPEICAVSAKLEDDDGTETNHEQLAVVSGIKLGICKFEITLPELDGGRGVRLTGEAKVGRVQLPGSDSGTAGATVGGHRALIKTALSAWWLFGLGWLTPNVVIVAFGLWKRRRVR